VRTRSLHIVFGWVGLLAGLLTGCGPKYAVEVLYAHRAQVQLNARIRVLAVCAFVATGDTDPRWARLVGARLAETLGDGDDRYSWDEVIGPQRLGGLLGSAGLTDRPGDEKAALAVADRAGAQAVITGSVSVDCRETRSETVGVGESLQRTCRVRIDFRLADPATEATLATRSIQRDYNSADSSVKLMDADAAVEGLIEDAVADFATMLASYEVRVTISLRPGKTYNADMGNRLATDGAYSQALAMYKRSLDTRPSDSGAAFNAGAMNEAMGLLDAAWGWYDRAFRMEAQSQYRQARQRVQRRMQRGH
jgi:hypothetical protein